MLSILYSTGVLFTYDHDDIFHLGGLILQVWAISSVNHRKLFFRLSISLPVPDQRRVTFMWFFHLFWTLSRLPVSTICRRKCAYGRRCRILTTRIRNCSGRWGISRSDDCSRGSRKIIKFLSNELVYTTLVIFLLLHQPKNNLKTFFRKYIKALLKFISLKILHNFF